MILLKRVKKPQVEDTKTLRVDVSICNQLDEISAETSIPVARLASMLLTVALSQVKIIDDEE